MSHRTPSVFKNGFVVEFAKTKMSLSRIHQMRQ